MEMIEIIKPAIANPFCLPPIFLAFERPMIEKTRPKGEATKAKIKPKMAKTLAPEDCCGAAGAGSLVPPPIMFQFSTSLPANMMMSPRLMGNDALCTLLPLTKVPFVLWSMSV